MTIIKQFVDEKYHGLIKDSLPQIVAELKIDNTIPVSRENNESVNLATNQRAKPKSPLFHVSQIPVLPTDIGTNLIFVPR